ncbi:MAG: glycosyltransferase family 4 protein [Pseudonocardiales bacterium]|nr:glycosyltransferase family 4 protein [Pseudonocardiales bacterium]MBV9032664.1 glycosyltransferase family 4 protein [Pseudonocardiales bacterium]
MKIGIITQWYSPERAPNPSATAVQLAERGHEVKVLTGFPNYPTGRVYPGYRQRWSHREVDGSVQVRRVPLYPSHDTNGIKRAANFLSFASSSTAAAGFLNDCDVVYVWATPMTAATAAAAGHALRGCPYVLHIQDLWPDSVLESGMAGGNVVHTLLSSTISGALRYLYQRAAHLVAVAPSMRQTLVDRGVPAEKVSVLYNWCGDESPAPPTFDLAVRDRLGRPGRTLAVFAGNVGQMQDVETIVRAAALCQHDSPLDVAIVGSGTADAAVRRLAAALCTTNIRFFDRVDSAEMPSIYAASDYQLVTLKDRPVSRGTIPSKLAAALSAGCPIITTVPGDVAKMCAEGGFGFSCEPESPRALADTFRIACAEDEPARLRKRGRAWDYYWMNMSMAAAIESLEAILADAVRSKVPAGQS